MHRPACMQGARGLSDYCRASSADARPQRGLCSEGALSKLPLAEDDAQRGGSGPEDDHASVDEHLAQHRQMHQLLAAGQVADRLHGRPVRGHGEVAPEGGPEAGHVGAPGAVPRWRRERSPNAGGRPELVGPELDATLVVPCMHVLQAAELPAEVDRHEAIRIAPTTQKPRGEHVIRRDPGHSATLSLVKGEESLLLRLHPAAVDLPRAPPLPDLEAAADDVPQLRGHRTGPFELGGAQRIGGGR
mmetsp:Transcript_108798/g.340244  ORF Transcript_108798/g.340244 Transcript_108798/m.340244 type:complete len:245 (+) Transcript_108798:1-735(+)